MLNELIYQLNTFHRTKALIQCAILEIQSHSIRTSYYVFRLINEYLSNKALVCVEGLRVLVGWLVDALRPSWTRPRSQRRRFADLCSQRSTFYVILSLINFIIHIGEPWELINTLSKVPTNLDQTDNSLELFVCN